MKNKSFLFITCDEAKHICDKAQYHEATTWEKLKLNIRYLWCHITKNYVKKNKKLTETIKSSKVTCLKITEKQHLNNIFQDKLKNNHP